MNCWIPLPSDIHKIYCVGKGVRPCLPAVPGDEGVGEVVEIGKRVCTVEPGDRVILSSRKLGTWRYYGVYNERNVHVISPILPLPEAAMLSVAPCVAYRMLKDFLTIKPGETVIQNAANSACGQIVIQLCKTWGINTINIVASPCDYDTVKEHLLKLGATAVYTLEEAEDLTTFDTSLSRPVLALNCLGGKYEDVMLKLLKRDGVIVYYGCAFGLPLAKQFLRTDATYCRFDLSAWDKIASAVQKDLMINDLIQLMVVGKVIAPSYEPMELKNFVYAIRNTVHCEAFSTFNYVFDFTLP